MLDSIISMILEKGGLGYALFLGAVYVASRQQLRAEAREAGLREQVAGLQTARVADAQKTRDDVVAVNRELVEVLTVNRAALAAVDAVMGDVLEKLPPDPDPTRKVPAYEPTRRLPNPR